MAPSSAETPAARVLLVEDDPDAAVFISRVLGGQGGFDVTHCVDPASALRLATTEYWDLVVTDVEAPGTSGLILLERLRQVRPPVPVAVITAHVAAGGAAGALRDRADEFLEKPLRPARLLEAAAELVSRARAARPASPEVVLAIGAHPDDAEIGAGGTLLVHRGAGHRVSILTLSRGARGARESEREQEARSAARILGADLILDDLDDSTNIQTTPAITAISRAIDQVRPTILYTHSINDAHQDHRNTCRAAMVAGRGVGRLYCFQSPSTTVEFKPSLFVGIDTQLPGKLAAIGVFASQIAVRDDLEPDLIQSTARYWGRFARSRYAEPFEVIRDRGAIAVGPTAKEPHVASA